MTVEAGCVVISSCVAVPGVTEMALLVADASVPLVTASVYPLPTLFKVTPEKLATPLVALTVSVPPSVLLPGLLASATVSLPVKPVATFPSASPTVTVKPNPLPAATVEAGCVVMSSCVAVPGVTEMALLVADASVPLVAASVYPLPTLLSVKPEKLATPLVALTVSVPPSVLLPGLLASATVSLPVKPVATFPSASSAVTVKPNPLPAVTVAGGWVVMSSCVAVPGVTEMALLVADVSVPPVTASVYPLPTLFKVTPEKLAMPLVALTVSVPPSVLLPGLLARARFRCR